MNILVLGGNSGIGYAISEKFAEQYNCHITLASRDLEGLEKKAKDLFEYYAAEVSTKYFDALDFDSHHDFYSSLADKPDIVVLSFGYLCKQHEAQKQFQEAYKTIGVNFLGAVSILEIIAADFEQKRKGIIIGISSVAGERGRMSNYIYGSSKAGLTSYLSGLRQRLYKAGIHVITVKPGFVKTPMTRDLEMPKFLFMEPKTVATKVVKAVNKQKNGTWIKWYWWGILFVLKKIPEGIFKRLRV